MQSLAFRDTPQVCQQTMIQIQPLPADLLFVYSPTWLGGVIRTCTRSPGEEPTYANHLAGTTVVWTKAQVREALWRVTTTPWGEWVRKTPNVELWRYKPLTENERYEIASYTEGYKGRPYGPIKLIGHLGDWALSHLVRGEVCFLRNLFRLDKFPICSWVWAHAYDQWRPEFWGRDPHILDPDTMHDIVKRDDDWTMVGRQGITV